MAEGPHQPPDAPTVEPAGGRPWRELPILIVVAIVVAIVIKTFLVQAFFIPSTSMVPTLLEGDRVLVCRVCNHFAGIHRGEIVVFSDPHPSDGQERGLIGGALHWLGEGIGVARPENPDFIKRVIGLPGDVVEIDRGQVIVNGEKLDEPYLDPDRDTRSFGKVEVPNGMLYVLGDNRLVSGDSRFPPGTGVGFVPEDKVIGRAFVTVWPPGRWRWL
ncbi:MAG TPA: signal peptidase I [Actinomycetota bacterium]|nr:signal peptidase I [Actinomycetota bacterium]